jgi:hypothetical protein
MRSAPSIGNGGYTGDARREWARIKTGTSRVRPHSEAGSQRIGSGRINITIERPNMHLLLSSPILANVYVLGGGGLGLVLLIVIVVVLLR